MSSISDQPSQQAPGSQEDEIVDAALDAVSGGQSQPIQKLDTMVVTATRLPSSSAAIQKMDPIVVTATRLAPDLAGTQVASAAPTGKKGS